MALGFTRRFIREICDFQKMCEFRKGYRPLYIYVTFRPSTYINSRTLMLTNLAYQSTYQLTKIYTS